MQQELKSLFAEIVGLNNVIDDPALFGPYTDDFTDHYVSKPLAVVRPSTTEQVSKIVKLCAQYNVPIVTQGGNTSLTGAATTYRPDAEIVLSMTKMKNVIDADPLSDTLTVQAGMTLAEVHEAAESVNRFFPLSFAATQPSAAAVPVMPAEWPYCVTEQHATWFSALKSSFPTAAFTTV